MVWSLYRPQMPQDARIGSGSCHTRDGRLARPVVPVASCGPCRPWRSVVRVPAVRGGPWSGSLPSVAVRAVADWRADCVRVLSYSGVDCARPGGPVADWRASCGGPAVVPVRVLWRSCRAMSDSVLSLESCSTGTGKGIGPESCGVLDSGPSADGSCGGPSASVLLCRVS
jgi:hypothetical protein